MKVFLGVGVLLSIAGSTLYFSKGYSLLVLILLLAGLILAGIPFYKRTNPVFDRKDIAIAGALILCFASLYLTFNYYVPWQINSDEVVVMRFANQTHADPLSPSSYFGFPTLPFLIFGKIGQLFGGINLQNMRMVQAMFGLLIIGASYFLFRLSLTKTYAVAGAIVVGTNHSLIALSRNAYWSTPGPLVAVVALTILLASLYKKSLFHAFIGGIFAGLSFYMYFNSRAVIGIWILTLIVLALRKQLSWRTALSFGAVSLLAFAMVATPIILKNMQNPSSTNYLREQFLIFPEGRELEKFWVSANTNAEAVKINLINGMTVFNSKVHDHGVLYHNPGHGFVDVLTGTLIWLGFFALLLKPKKNYADYAMLAGFLATWLFFSIMITKSPNYNRLLITLPFAAYLVVQAINFIIGKRTMILVYTLGTIIFLNISIYGDHVMTGFTKGEVLGGAARYIEERTNMPNYHFYLAASKEFGYFRWGDETLWQSWTGFFAKSNVTILDPTNFTLSLGSPPFTVFMNYQLWEKSDSELRKAYPNYRLHITRKENPLVAVEVT